MSECEPLTLRFPARPSSLKRIRGAVADRARQLGCGDACMRDIVIAVDEACQNIIRHAYGRRRGDVVLEMRRDGDALIVRLIDFAAPVDVSRIRPRPLDELRPGGLGTHLMCAVMDEVVFLPAPEGCGNMLQMVKRIAP